MAKFTIYSPSGTALYTGTPSFTGQYMKPGMLEFREVALPALVDLSPGCYVDYTRTGHRYRIYTAPQLKKQARSYSYGGAFVYQSVQLYDDTKMLEYCPFRDLVLGDNRVHFSTQPSISTFEGCDGLARRFEACLQDQYGANSWRVRIATQAENPALYDLMMEPREFTVSGVNILECLDKVYEIWPEVGWVYKVEIVDGSPVDTIIIGGGGVLTNSGIYAYGKGNGLISLTRTAANADELANRIFAYGSSRNMLPGWYNNQDIKDAESVNIQNLMLPVDAILSMDWDGWGMTDGDPDAAKAYVEDDDSIQKNGLRPATVYFDGSGEYPEIYPTIREATIGMVRTAIGDSTAQYYPSTTVYTNPSQRIDRILSAPASFDSGLAGTGGKATVDSEYTGIDESETTTFPAGYAARSVFTYQGVYTPSASGNFSISLGLNISGSITLPDIKSVNILAGISESGEGGKTILSGAQSIDVEPGATSVTLHNLSFNASRVPIQSGVSYNVSFIISVEAERSVLDRPCLVRIAGGYSIALSNYRTKTFTVSIPQIGFDINEQAVLGDGKTIAMRTGKCAGRSFSIKSVQYDATTDSWALECWRSEDESLSQWFPNTDFPVRGLENAGETNEYPGDEFVLLDIAMPDIYIQMAEQKLLTAARELLADSAVERWQYTPEIDAKFMVENGRTIHPGEYLVLRDANIIGDTPESILVDTVTINEGESAIPTYKVSLRDRKKKTWTESKGAESQSSKSVGNITEQQQSSQSFESQYFTLDDNGNVTLKPQYENLWVPGWLAAGGIGTGGGGGGGGLIQTVYTVSDLGTIGFESVTETFSAYAIDSIYKGSGASLSLTTVSTTSYLKDSLGNYLLDSNGNRLALPGSSSISRLNLLNGEGAVLSSVDLDLDLSAYVPTTRKINGHPLTSDVTLSATADLGVAEWALGGAGSTIPFNILPLMYVARTQVTDTPGNDTLLGVDAISYNSASGESDASRIEWLPDAGGSGVGAWHLKGNLYVDGWLAVAGIGTGNGGSEGGGGASYLDDLEDVDAPSPSIGDLLAWNGNEWANSNNYYTKGQVVTALGTSGNYLTWTKNGVASNITVPFATTATSAIKDGNGNTISETYALASSMTDVLARLAQLEDLFEIVNGAVHVKRGRAFYADLWIAAGGVGTAGSGGGIYLPDVWDSLTNTVADEYANTEISLAHIPAITTSKVSDINNWITTKSLSIAGLSVNIGGSISTASLKQALGISGDETPTISSVVLTNGPTYSEITVDDTSASFYTKSQVDALIPSLANYLPLTGGTMTGALLMNGASIYPSSDLGASLGDSTRRFNNGNIVTIGTRTINFFHQTTGNRDVMLAGSDGYLRIRTGANTEQSYKDIIFHESYGLYPEYGSSVNLGYHSNEDNRFRWATIYGVNEDLTGNLSLASASHIDIGPLRIEYDPDAKALHITKASAQDTNNYGIYTDGILVGGGIQEQTT